ncbi:hypothetical protein N0V87_009679 [Didymella glomerata]|uniref:Nucleoporin Nup159/Nup146 N-terminal domain-containing protein n=1 Tax=Didymella glomerata TaxID=749621 RepID=A0A9W8WQP7_9PLEO|nr:hypothetical protein N0V87_009679 [Didymella glomerata]
MPGAPTLAPPGKFIVPGPATLAQIEKERAEAKAREERELSERLARSQGSEARNTPTPSRATPTRFNFRSSLSYDSPTSLKKSLELFRPSPSPASPSKSVSAKSSPVLQRFSSHDPSPKLFRRQTSRELRPEYQRASMSFSQSASAPAANVGADVPSILAEELSFKALSQGAEGPKKLKLLPNPWPTDDVPPASVTLLSIASKSGLLAAAGPDTLVLASTEKVRKAFQEKAGEWDVITDFAPDATLPVPKLRHVAFSSEGDFLVISAENGGGLAVFDPKELLKGKQKPGNEIATDKQAIRALLPNPIAEMEHIFAAILDNGRLCLIDVASGKTSTLREDGVVCASWSTRGKALAVGLEDGTGVLYLNDGTQKGVIPRPPALNGGFTYCGLVWLANDEFFIVHFPKKSAIDTGEPEEARYHYVRSNKGWTSFSFHPTPEEPILPAWDAPTRAFPPRLSVTRLRSWEPDLDDLLILTNSHSDTIVTVTSASNELSRGGPVNEYTTTELNEGQGAQVPRRVFGEEGDSLLIGEALDLSATEKLMRPIASNEEITEAPYPLPAYVFLTHQGILSAYWVVWNRSIAEGKRYPGLVAPDSSAAPAPQPTPSKIPTPGGTSSLFGKPSAPAFGAPSTPSAPKFGASPFGSTTPAASFGKPAFGAPSTPAFGQASQPSATPFGQPAKPAFGAPSSMGSSSPFSQPAGSTTPAFGQSSKPSLGAATGSTQPAFGQTGKPAFGAPSAPGAAAFGAASGIAKASPWGSASPQASSTPANPFSGGGSSGFAKFGQPTPGAGSASPFGGTSSASPFGGAAPGQSGFGGLGQQKSSPFGGASGGQSGFAGLGQQKSAFGGASNATPNLKEEPSFGSTVTVGSNNGSTVPSFGNSAQQSGSIFGQKTTNSLATNSSFASTDSGADTQRKRDESTPTPQPPSGLNGIGSGAFKLGSTFKGDGTAKDDLPKPAAPGGSFFGSGFASMVPNTGLQPKTPGGDGSTTPLSPPKKTSYFPGTTPQVPPPIKKEPQEDAPLPPDFTKTAKKTEPGDDAPLPPDFVTSKPKSQPADDPLPPDFLPKKASKSADEPLAGSPGVKVEVPSSSPEAVPLDDDDEEEFSGSEEDEEGDEEGEEGEDGSQEEEYSDEEEDEEDEEEDEDRPLPTTLGNHKIDRPESQSKPLFSPDRLDPGKSNLGSLFPPTPAPAKSGTAQPSSLFGAKAAPQATGSQPLFGQAAPKSASLFQTSQQAKPAVTPSFQPPRAQTALRSPSPIRPSSQTSHRPTTRREPSAPGSSLSTSFQQSKPPTPQVSDLEDQEDERIRAQLAQEIEPSRTLDDFVAHQKYTGTSEKTGHAAQIEAIYKDINGMVDALGWNARSIKSFTTYHKQPQSGHKVDRQTLEDVEADGKDGAWYEQFALSEIRDLQDLEDKLSQELDEGRIQNVHDKLVQLRRLILEKAKLMTRINDIRRQIINRKDPEKVESTRKAALPKELADTQKALRADYAKLLTLLSQAEEAAILLRSRLASHSASAGNTTAVPSMDAVKKTIIKMTALAERRNNDIALLESQMRRVGLNDGRPTSLSSPANGAGATTPCRARGTDLRKSITDTPFTTPPTRGKMSLSDLNRRALTPEVQDSTPSKGYGLFYDAPETAGGNDLARLSDMVDDNIEELRQTARRRRAVASGLRKVLLERGVKSTSVA